MDDELRLDGNTAAGPLGEVFSFEMTMAQYACEGGGRNDRLGAPMVYQVRQMGTNIAARAATTPLSG